MLYSGEINSPVSSEIDGHSPSKMLGLVDILGVDWGFHQKERD
jgi:hypothetical protein